MHLSGCSEEGQAAVTDSYIPLVPLRAEDSSLVAIHSLRKHTLRARLSAQLQKCSLPARHPPSETESSRRAFPVYLRRNHQFSECRW